MTISGNTAGSAGGGLYCLSNSEPTLTNVTITNNTSSSGGGIYAENSSLSFYGGTISNNTAQVDGGGICAINVNLVMKTIDVTNNSCGGNGGGMYYKGFSEKTIIASSNFLSNQSTGNSGGIHMHQAYGGSDVIYVNTLIANNTSSGVGGFGGYDSWPSFYNVTIANNHGSVSGGLDLNNGSRTKLTNVIVHDNYPYNIRVSTDGSYRDSLIVNYSNINGGVDGINIAISPVEINWGTGNIDSDPLFADTANGDYTLLAGSPAIDVGNPNAFYNDGDGSRNDMGYTGGNGFVLSATEIDFGYLGLGDSRNKTITISNTNPDGIQITGASFDDSQFATSQSFPVNMAHYSSVDIQFTFTPTTTGAQSGTLQLSSQVIPGSDTYGEFALSGNAFDLTDGVVQVPGEVPTIQGAIDATSDGDTVLVATGTYYEHLNFKGKEIVVESVNGPEMTIIDGDSSGRCVRMNNGENNNTVLRGFTIQNGNYSSSGGGIYCDFTSPVLENLILQQNSSSSVSALEVHGGRPIIKNTKIINNSNSNVPTVRTKAPATPIFINVLIADNGSGIKVQEGSFPQFYNCTIANNGGGLVINQNNASAYFLNTIFWGNADSLYLDGHYSKVEYSIVQGGISGTGNSVNDPLLDSNYTLQAGSPAINGGNPLNIYNDTGGTRNDIGYTGGNGLVLASAFKGFFEGVGGVATETFKFVNTRDSSVTIAWEVVTGSEFSITTNTGVNIEPFETKDIDITYTPDDVSDDSDQLNITSSDFEGGTTVLIPLEGTVTQFADVSEAAGFQQTDLNNGTSGSSWADVDNDGDMDLFLPNQWTNNNLYINDGDGTFTEVTSDPVVDEITSYSNGSSWADYDDDDDMDLFVTTVWGDNNVNYLYTNDGDGTFTKVTSGDIVNTQHMSWGGVWGDYDNDNDLDIIVAAHENNMHEIVYINDGDGTFTTFAGNNINQDNYGSKNVNWIDYDNDDDFDIFICNRGDKNTLLRNNGDGTHTKISDNTLVNNPASSSSSSWGDYDNDLDLDLFVGNTSPNKLYTNNGDGTFTSVSNGQVVTDYHYTHGSNWGDIDNDGDLDILVLSKYQDETAINLIYSNNGDGTFTREFATGAERSGGTSGSFCDYDQDGDLDLMLAQESKSHFLKNNYAGSNNWLVIRLNGSTSNTTGIGARVKVKATINGQEVWQMREINGNSGLNAMNSQEAHFGLGNATDAEMILVEWPSGANSVVLNENPNQYITINEADITADGLLTVPYEFTTIQAAISAASDGDTIYVFSGTYVENINYNGKNISIIGEDRETTIIDGNQSGRVVTLNSGESNALLKYFTIQNGHTVYDGSSSESNNGGGIYIGAVATIQNCIIKDNISDDRGGGLFIPSDEVILKNNIIIHNTSPRGGGLAIQNDIDVSLINNTIINNNGIGVWLTHGADATIVNCIIYNNSGNEIEFRDIDNPVTLIISYSNIDGPG